MYSFQSRVRYSEVDSEGRLSIYGVLNYLQDCSTFQSEALGIGLAYLKKQYMAWVLNYWQVDILRYPDMGEEIEIGTIPYDIKGFMGYRNFFIRTMEGEMLAKANSIWTLIDTRSIRPVRVTQEMVDGYVIGQRLDMEYLDRKIKVTGKASAQLPPLTVKRHNIDTNQHVNNAQYVLIAMDYIPEETKIKRLRAEYKSSARLGDQLYPVVTSGEGWEHVALCNQEDGIYATVLFDKG
ncbi:MAG: acyl-[Lachnospiraceae bacterium]|nr:acyl-[acyl-carrier-protein] thioesterase [Lachnospiraceae bacterium]